MLQLIKIMWIQIILAKLKIKSLNIVCLWCDNISENICFFFNFACHAITKYIEVMYYFFARVRAIKKLLKIDFVPIED